MYLETHTHSTVCVSLNRPGAIVLFSFTVRAPQDPETISICNIYPRLFSLPSFYPVNPSFPWWFLWSPWVEKQVTINIRTARSSRREAARALKSLTDSPGVLHTLTHRHTHAKVMIIQNTHKHTHGVSDAATVTTRNMNLSTHRWICKSREKAVSVKNSCDNLSLHLWCAAHLVFWIEKKIDINGDNENNIIIKKMS